jgi:AraC-like DNA-binding protein
MPVLIETTDVEAACQVFATLYNIRRFAAPGDRPYMRIGQDQFGPVGLHRLTFSMECDVDGAPLDALWFGYLGAGEITYHYGRHIPDSPVYGPGDVFLALEPDVPYHADLSAADLHFAAFGPSLLAQVADSPGRLARPIQFTAFQPATPEDTRLWLRIHGLVRDQLHDAPAVAPLVTGAAARLLAATALSVFPNDALTEPTAEDRHDAHPATLRRAVSFIDDNAHSDITPADIAAAAHVTIRALQLSFRRHLGCTPTTYLRRIRLEHAHRDLLAADPQRETVTAVAYRWGFASHSRFTAHYRHAYGVLPSDTLRG